MDLGSDPPSLAFLADEADAASAAGEDHLYAVGVAALQTKLRGGVPKIGKGRELAFAFNLHGPGPFRVHAPVGHVDEVGAPVGELPAGVVEVPPEGPVAAIQ